MEETVGGIGRIPQHTGGGSATIQPKKGDVVHTFQHHWEKRGSNLGPNLGQKLPKVAKSCGVVNVSCIKPSHGFEFENLTQKP